MNTAFCGKIRFLDQCRFKPVTTVFIDWYQLKTGIHAAGLFDSLDTALHEDQLLWENVTG